MRHLLLSSRPPRVTLTFLVVEYGLGWYSADSGMRTRISPTPLPSAGRAQAGAQMYGRCTTALPFAQTSNSCVYVIDDESNTIELNFGDSILRGVEICGRVQGLGFGVPVEWLQNPTGFKV